MEQFVFRLLSFLGIVALAFGAGGLGGWKVYKKYVRKAYCYGGGARRFIKPPSLDRCLTFCEKYRMQFCEYGPRDGFCYAKDSCSKMRESKNNRLLNIYKMRKGARGPVNTPKKNRPNKNRPNTNGPKTPTAPNKGTGAKGKPKKTRDPTRPLTVKLGILVSSELANAFYKLYGISGKANKEGVLQAQVLTNYLYGLNTVYSDKSIGKLKVKIVVTHFSVVPKSTWRKWKDVYAYCKSPLQTGLTDVDAVMYLVKSGGASSKGVKLWSSGRSITGGICKQTSRCGMVNEVASVDTAYKRLTAHELGHLVGLIDDGPGLKGKLRRSRKARRKAAKGEYPYDDMRCDGQKVKSVMAGKADKWSVCSRARFKTVFGSELSSCLDNPAKTALLPKASDLVGKQKQFTRKEMCEMLKVQDSNTATWSVHYKKPAAETDCKFAKNECFLQAPATGRFAPMKMFDDVPMMQGAKCSKGACFFGECLSDREITAKMEKVTS